MIDSLQEKIKLQEGMIAAEKAIADIQTAAVQAMLCQNQPLQKLLQQAHAAALDPSPRNPGKVSKLIDKALAKLEKSA